MAGGMIQCGLGGGMKASLPERAQSELRQHGDLEMGQAGWIKGLPTSSDPSVTRVYKTDSSSSMDRESKGRREESWGLAGGLLERPG